jgi:hypothetical protein
MNENFAIIIKGESYNIPLSYKTDIQSRITKINADIDSLKAQITNLNNDKKLLCLDLLNDRQKIIYQNPLPKIFNELIPESKKHIELKKLLEEYDRANGHYYKPLKGH